MSEIVSGMPAAVPRRPAKLARISLRTTPVALKDVGAIRAIARKRTSGFGRDLAARGGISRSTGVRRASIGQRGSFCAPQELQGTQARAEARCNPKELPAIHRRLCLERCVFLAHALRVHVVGRGDTQTDGTPDAWRNDLKGLP